MRFWNSATRSFVALLLLVRVAAAQPGQPLTSIQQIRGLTAEQAKSGLPVEIRGVVTFSKPSIATVFVHDGQSGIFVEQASGTDETGLQNGDRVVVKGITGEGFFAPVIKRPPSPGTNVEVLEHGPMPEPRLIDGHELSRPQADADWVSIDTSVLEVQMLGDDVIFDCRSDTFDFQVLLEGPSLPESVPWDLTEAKIRVTGVVATIFNSGRQMTGRFIRINSLADVVPLDMERLPTSEAPLVRADGLMRSSGPGPVDSVRVRGVTSFALPGLGLYLQVDGGAIWVQTAQPIAATSGTVVEVVGWPRPGELKPFIRARRVSILGAAPPPKAIPLKAIETLKARHDAELVSVEAELLNSFQSPDGTTLELRDADMVFRGLISDQKGVPLPKLEPGSRLRITGIARISPGTKLPLQVEEKLLLLARSPADVVVLAPPPFWSARNVSIGSAAIFAGLLGFYGNSRIRRRREEKVQRREFEAVLAERGRFAREIHDSLAQGLTSISLQLECVRDQLPVDPATAATHVENARSLVRDSLKEARRTVWNLRPLALGETDLVTALQRYAANLTADGKITFSQQIEGTPRPLPPAHEDTLLRIGQEALTNASRHAAATEITQKLRFGSGWVTMIVGDNGRGFDVFTKVGSGFGLTGMHERVAALGGSLSIDSHPGRGTEVSATLPT